MACLDLAMFFLARLRAWLLGEERAYARMEPYGFRMDAIKT